MRLLAEGELLAAVHEILDPVVTAAWRGGRLPSMKSDEFLLDVSNDVHGGDTARWAALAAQTPREVVLAARQRVVTNVRCTCGVLMEVGHPLPDLAGIEGT